MSFVKDGKIALGNEKDGAIYGSDLGLPPGE